MSRPVASFALVVLLIVTAGCVGGPSAVSDTQAPTEFPTTPPPTTGPTTTGPGATQPSYLTPTVECPEVDWVEFYGVGEFWRPDAPLIGYTIAGETTVSFVAYVDGEVAGVRETRFETDSSVTADGSKVELDEPLSGVHTIRIVAHADVDGNQEFEPETDRPCRNDGEVVQTGVERLNFSELEGSTTPERTDR